MPQDLNISVRVLPSLLRNCYLLTAISTTFFMFNFLNPKNERVGAEMVYLNILSLFLLFYALYNNYTAGLWMSSEIEYAEQNYRDDLQNSLDLFKQRMFQNNIFNFFLIALIGFAILNIRYSDILSDKKSDNGADDGFAGDESLAFDSNTIPNTIPTQMYQQYSMPPQVNYPTAPQMYQTSQNYRSL